MNQTAAPLDGSWEKPGRNPLAAGIAGLLIVGALYSTLGSVFLSIIIAVMMPSSGSWLASGSIVDLILGYYRTFRVPILAVTMGMELVLFFGLVLVLTRRWHSSRPFAFLSYRRPAALDLVLAGVGAAAVVPLAELLDRWSSIILPPLRELAGGQGALLAAGSAGQAVFVVCAVAVTPAICEEALFRGWLQGALRRKLHAVPTIVLQAVLFALFHMSPLSIVALAFVGLYLGFLFERCGTLFASMTAHCVYNATIIAVVDLAPSWIASDAGLFTLPVIGISVVLFALVVFAIEVRSRGRRVTPVEPPSA